MRAKIIRATVIPMQLHVAEAQVRHYLYWLRKLHAGNSLYQAERAMNLVEERSERELAPNMADDGVKMGNRAIGRNHESLLLRLAEAWWW